MTMQTLALILGSGWASGLNLYLTAAALGIAGRMDWIALPGGLQILENPLVIFFAILLYAVQFIIDKIPYLDSAWDSVHTLIRPVGAAVLASLAAEHASEGMRWTAAALAGAASLNAHIGKAGTRVVINTSPEPFTNSAASIAEDSLVLGLLWLVFRHPLISILIVIALIGFTIWLIPKIFRLIKKFFQMIAGKKGKPKKAEAVLSVGPEEE